MPQLLRATRNTRARRTRLAAWVPWLAVSFAFGCTGNGCSCLSPIPGGYPAAERDPNAVQARISETGLTAIEADPAALVGGLMGTGTDLTFDIPPACDADPYICCEGGVPADVCGPIAIDLEAQPGDQPRLELTPVAGADRIDLTLRARVSTVTDLPFTLYGSDCSMHIDTADSGDESLRMVGELQFSQDADAGTTRVDLNNVTVDQVDNGDLTISGGVMCTIYDWLKGLFIGTLVGTIESNLQDAVNGAMCKTCASGDVAECGEFADSCTDGVCQKTDGSCLQELGMSGRMTAATALESFAPDTPGAIDIYYAAGGYATTEQNGAALGLLGGILPAGEARDRCGPPADPPADEDIPIASFFQGNVRPDTSEPFDFAIGIHRHNLDRFAYSAYDSGFLCINISTRTVDLLNSDTLSVLMPSFIDLTHGENAQIILGLRPQSPPTITLGPGTFTTGGDVDEPLLDIFFDAMELDFYGMVDDRFIRLMTVRADVDLPLGLDVSPEGEILPVLGDLDQAFTNLEVFNSEALIETPEELADKFPAVLSLALPFLADALGTFALPQLGGLTLEIQPGGITSVEDDSGDGVLDFLAIFGNLSMAEATALRVDTTAELGRVEVPDTSAFTATRLDPARRPYVDLVLGGSHPGGAGLEWSVRVDGSLWSPYSRDPEPSLSRPSFWLQGRHRIEVRARVVGRPETTDLTPVVLEPVIDTLPPRLALRSLTRDTVWVMATDNVTRRPDVEYRLAGGAWHAAGPAPVRIDLHGEPASALEVRATDQRGNLARATVADSPTLVPGGAGAGCSLGRGSGGGLGGLLLLFAVVLGLRRRGRSAALLVALLAVLPTSGCSCGGDTTGDYDALNGGVERGPTGRWSSIAAYQDRVVIAAYEQSLGDLVLVEPDADGNLTYRPIAGVPDEEPVYDPDGYRGGILQAGPDVGAWTSIAMPDGQIRVAYQNRDDKTLEFIAETPEGWQHHTVDDDHGDTGEVGLYASLAYDGAGVPAIAYLATGLDDGAGGKLTQLRYARASGQNPTGTGDWTVTVVAEASISCSGLCDSGLACVAGDTGEQCVATTSDCDPECASGEVCTSGACLAEIPDPPAYDLPLGVGLFANLTFLGDTPAIVGYDRTTTDLMLYRLTGGDWQATALDATEGSDTGRFASIAVDSAGTLHVAYQDEIHHQLLYTSFADDTVGPIEVVDNGVREGDRPHPVGASSAVMVTASGQIAVAYQDSATSDLLLARRIDGEWQREDLLSSVHLDGFFVDAAATSAAVELSSYQYDRSVYPPGQLVITTIP